MCVCVEIENNSNLRRNQHVPSFQLLFFKMKNQSTHLAGGTLFMPAVPFVFLFLFYSVGCRYIISHTSSSNYPPKKQQQHLKQDVISEQQSQQSEEKKTSMLVCLKPCNCTRGYECYRDDPPNLYELVLIQSMIVPSSEPGCFCL